MLSYQHVFHAGNHADILKHFVLTFVLNSLNKKEKSYTFFDTHSGSGLYDFCDERSKKTLEAENGILTLLKMQNIPPKLEIYLSFIKKYVQKNLYPGSPEIERSFLRTQDFLVLTELHPKEFENLQKNIKNPIFEAKNSPKIQIFNKDGFKNLNALTPPATKRGAVLIDPSYEENQDYVDVQKTICNVYKKWTNGIFMLWYPLLAHKKTEIENMIFSIKDFVLKINKNTEIANLQVIVNDENSHKETDLKSFLSDVDKKNPPRLYGSGMLVINSPWHLQEDGKKVCEYLSDVFFQKRNS